MRLKQIAGMLVLCCTIVTGQTASPSGTMPNDIAIELGKLRAAISSQQKQILEQQKRILEEEKQMAAQQEEIEKLTQQLAAGSSNPPPPQVIDATLHTVGAVPPIRTQQESPAKESPLSFRIGGTEFTPGGFVDFENVFRTTNSGSIITTNFGLIPFSNTPQGHITENR